MLSKRTLYPITTFLSGSLFCASLSAAELQLAISGFKKTTGEVFISVFNNENDWLTENMVASKNLLVADAIKGNSLRVSLQLEPGEYAVSLYQDVNGNGIMDTRKLIPIPKEPIGLSNNIKPRFGPPKYKDAKFSLLEDVQELSIQLQ